MRNFEAYKQAENLLNDFDFEAVRKYMQSVNWTWAGYLDTPSVESLRAAAQNVLNVVIRETRQNTLAATGGFYAYKFTWDSGQIELRLSFDAWGKSKAFRE